MCLSGASERADCGAVVCKRLPSPVIQLQGHALLVGFAWQLGLPGEDALGLQDDALHQGVDQLQGGGVPGLRATDEAGPEAHGQVVGLHHVLVAVLRHAAGGGRHRQAGGVRGQGSGVRPQRGK